MSQLFWPSQNKDSINTVTIDYQWQFIACQVPMFQQMSPLFWALSFYLSSFLYYFGIGSFISFSEEEITLKHEHASFIFQDFKFKRYECIMTCVTLEKLLNLPEDAVS